MVTLKDNLTRLVKAAYALDSGEWVPVFPDDGLFDTPSEAITIRLPDLKPGTHVLMVRATDAAGNVGTGDALIERADETTISVAFANGRGNLELWRGRYDRAWFPRSGELNP